MKVPIKALGRREFLRFGVQLGLSAAVLEGFIQLGTSLTRSADKHAGQSAHHWAMAIDLDACVGCNFCTYACKAVNDTADGVNWNAVFKDQGSFSKAVYIPRPCMHCEHAPCVEVCPVGATYYRPDGLIAMDYDKCIGCRYCQVACPYGARYFNWQANTQVNPMVPEWGTPEVERRQRGVIEKCTFCAQRIDAGLANGLTPGVDRMATPACVNVCPVGARVFGDLNDPDSKISQVLAAREHIVMREAVGTKPRVFYLLPERSV